MGFRHRQKPVQPIAHDRHKAASEGKLSFRHCASCPPSFPSAVDAAGRSITLSRKATECGIRRHAEAWLRRLATPDSFDWSKGSAAAWPCRLAGQVENRRACEFQSEDVVV